MLFAYEEGGNLSYVAGISPEIGLKESTSQEPNLCAALRRASAIAM